MSDTMSDTFDAMSDTCPHRHPNMHPQDQISGGPEPIIVRVVDLAPVPEPRGHPYIAAGGRPRIRPGQDAHRLINPWKQAVRQATAPLAPDDHLLYPAGSPVVVSWRFWLPRPDSHFRAGRNRHLLKPSAPSYPTAAKRSDLDNLIKAAKDAIGDWQRKRCLVWADDAQVVGYGTAWKYYADDDHPMGVEIIIEPAPAIEPGRYDSRRIER